MTAPTGGPIVAVFAGGPFDGEQHALPHADVEWRVVQPPAGDDAVTPATPRAVYVRDEHVGAMPDRAGELAGRPVWRYRYDRTTGASS